VEREKPAIVLLDIMMPDVDGYEVCRQIKQNDSLKHIHIIFLSAKSKDSDISKGIEMGASLYITKPFSTRNLLEKVKELLA